MNSPEREHYSIYYQAKLVKKTAWFVSGCFRNEDHVAFARALEGHGDVFEFFVAPKQQERFLYLMNTLKSMCYVVSYEQRQNRFAAQKDC